MKHISTYLLMSFLAVMIASCSTSHNTVGGGIQKRKYTKGFYHNRKSSGKDYSARDKKATLVAAKEEIRSGEAVETAVQEVPAVQQTAQTVIVPQTQQAFQQQDQAVEKTQKSEEHQKSPAKKKASDKKSPKPSTPARPRKEREHEYYIPVKTKKHDMLKQQSQSGRADDMLILAVIFAILIPPVGVAIYEGITTRFWISLILTLLFFFPGMIYALLVVCGVI